MVICTRVRLNLVAAVHCAGSDTVSVVAAAPRRPRPLTAGRPPQPSEDPLAPVRARALQLLSQLAAAGLAGEEGAPATACSRAPALKLAVPFSDLKPTLCLGEATGQVRRHLWCSRQPPVRPVMYYWRCCLLLVYSVHVVCLVRC